MQLTRHALFPVADRADARTTARVLEPYEFDRITVLHVVEKGDGVPDKTPVEQSEQVAAEAFDVFEETFPDVETKVTYRRDVVEGIVEAADEVDASAIVFRPRGGARILQFIAGDRSLRLMTEADRPVVSVPDPEDT
jgi:nucleotide-binding universal stress UspA family protein